MPPPQSGRLLISDPFNFDACCECSFELPLSFDCLKTGKFWFCRSLPLGDDVVNGDNNGIQGIHSALSEEEDALNSQALGNLLVPLLTLFS